MTKGTVFVAVGVLVDVPVPVILAVPVAETLEILVILALAPFVTDGVNVGEDEGVELAVTDFVGVPVADIELVRVTVGDCERDAP